MAEPGFDDIAELARDVCETPVALVSLVADDRQWFLARAGFELRETGLDVSICAHALVEPDLLVIPDLAADARTRQNPLVTGAPHVRFYAGAPLRTPGGEAIGSLCVIDTAPRPAGLTERQARSLRALGRQVMALIEARRALREHDDALIRTRLAQSAGRIGTFEVDVGTSLATVSPEFCEVFGIAARPTVSAIDIEAAIVPEDRKLASTAANRVDGSSTTDVEYRIRRGDDGRQRWVSRRAEFVRDEGGRIVRMFGTVHDVTDRRLLQAKQDALLELGDRLRATDDAKQVAAIAAEILGRVLAGLRAGYARVDRRADLIDLAPGWSGPGAADIEGRIAQSLFRATIDRLATGETLAICDIETEPTLAADLEGYRQMGTRAQIKVPIVERGDLIGLLYVHDGLPRTWTPEEITFAQAIADRMHAALGKVRAEAQQHVLNSELSHRMKNTLAMVQAIAAQTLKGAVNQAALDGFTKRIHALASAHDVLLQQKWAAARIREVIEAVLGQAGRIDSFDIAGPDINLGPRATLSLSLLLHELVTNASKYGALSVEDGRIAVSWDVDRAADGDADLCLRWIERGGPAARKPDRRGFGSRLISMGLVGTGGANLRYSPLGFEAEFRAPLDQIQDS